MISKYIDKLTDKGMVFVIKNFSQCDESSMAIISKVIISSVNSKFIISIDKSDFNNNTDLKYDFLYKACVIPIRIEKFTHYKYFVEMISDIFNFTKEDYNSIEHLFNICSGYPGELKQTLAEYWINNSQTLCNLTSKKIDFNYQEIIKCTYPKETTILSKIMGENENMTQFILLFVVLINMAIPYSILIKLSESVLKQIHILRNKESIDKIEEAVRSLLYKYQILNLSFFDKSAEQMVSLNNNIVNIDKLYLEFEEKRGSIIPMLCSYIAQYLLANESAFLNFVDQNIYNSKLSWLLWKAQWHGWEQKNLEIGIYFLKNNQISLAKNIFLRLEEYWDVFSIDERFLISSCFYSTGKYDLAEKAISKIPICQFNNYNQFVLSAKIKNMNMKKLEAVNILTFMLENEKFSENKYEILDLKQRFLSIIKGKRGAAKTIFDQLQNEFDTKKINYCDFLISSMEFYRGVKVQKDFDILEAYYKRTNNQLMISELTVNRGFDLFWQGKISEAKSQFKESIKSLESVQIHEISYALNNYANCLMMEGNFEEAISSLKRAEIFNASQYTDIVLKTHLMVCYIIEDDPQYLELYKYLEDFLIQNENLDMDISIYLKVYYSLGFVQHFKNGPAKNFKPDYTKKAIELAETSDSTVLPYIWFKNWKNEVEEDICRRVNRNQYSAYFNYRFEPWLLTITHD